MHTGVTTTVYLRLNLRFTPTEPGALTGVEPVWLDVRNCLSDRVFDVPSGDGPRGRHREEWTYEMPRAGEFIEFRGHLHDGGIKLVLRNDTTGAHLFTSRALYEKERDPWYLTGMTRFSAAPGISVDSGDVLRLTAVYDSSRRWDDVMGIMHGALVPAP
jgi:hypothetical protein